MSTYYDLYENPNPDKEDKTTLLHPRVVSKGTISQDEFLDRVHKFTGISRSLLSGSMESFYQELCNLLADGWNVELGELGYFSASLQAPAVKKKSEIRAGSIQFKNVNFRPSNHLKKEIASKMTFERCASPTRPNKNNIPEEACLSLVNEYLDKYPCINRSQYCSLTGRDKQTALKELNTFIEHGILMRHGVGKQVVYAKNKESK